MNTRLAATADFEAGRIRSLDAAPRILPDVKCPSATPGLAAKLDIPIAGFAQDGAGAVARHGGLHRAVGGEEVGEEEVGGEEDEAGFARQRTATAGRLTN